MDRRQQCEHCGHIDRVVELPNCICVCVDCDVDGGMIKTAYGWYYDQQGAVPVDDWTWNDRGNGPELISPDGVYGPFQGPSEEEAEQQAKDWMLRLNAEQDDD